MLKREDIKKLADLSRINIEDSELGALANDMDSILGFVGQISSVISGIEDKGIELGQVYNVLREDRDPNESGVYSKELIDEFPNRDGNYLKVKKIL